MRGIASTLAMSSRAAITLIRISLSLLVVGIFAAAEQDVDLHLVAVFQEGPGLLDLEVDIVVARFGAQADFLELLLMLSWRFESASSSARI